LHPSFFKVTIDEIEELILHAIRLLKTMSSYYSTNNHDEESLALLLPPASKLSQEKTERTDAPRGSSRVGRSALLIAGTFVVFLGLGLLGYSGLSVSGLSDSWRSTDLASDSCSKLFSGSISSFKKDLVSCRSSIASGASVPFCLGSSADCTAKKSDSAIFGSVSASGTIDLSGAAQSVQVQGKFSAGAFLFVLGNLATGKGSAIRGLIGGLASMTLDGTLSIDMATSNAGVASFATIVTGTVSVQNNIQCTEPLSCALYALIPSSARSKPTEFSTLAGLELSFSFELENIMSPHEWEVVVAIQMKGTTIVDKKAWLRDMNGVGPKIYLRLSPDDLPVPGVSMPLDICVQNCKSGTPKELYFAGSLELDGASVAGTLEFNSWWAKAFGIPILHLGFLRVGLAVPFATPTVISALSLGGRVCLGRQDVCVPPPGGNAVSGNLIAGAAYMGVNFDPTKADENYVFVAITEVSIEKILQVFEDGMNFPNLRSVIPPPFLVSGLYPYSKAACTPNQISDFVNNLGCFATMSFSPGGPVEIVASQAGVLTIPGGSSVSARLNFMGAELQMKLDMSTEPTSPYLRMRGSMTPLNVKDVITLTKTKVNAVEGPQAFLDCDPLKLQCNMGLSGYIKVPVLTLEGEVQVSMQAQLPSGMVTKFDFNSMMFGLYDMQVRGEFNSPTTTYMNFMISISTAGHKTLADALAVRAQQFLDAVNRLTTQANNRIAGISGEMSAKCRALSGSAFAVGPVNIGGYRLEKKIKIGKKILGSFIGFDKTFSVTFGDSYEILPRLSVNAESECINAANRAAQPLEAQVRSMLNSLNTLADSAKSSLAGLNNPSQYFNLETFTFAANFNFLDVAAGMLFDLKMTVASRSVSVHQNVAYNVDVQGVVYDAVVSQALPILNRLQEMQDIVNNIDRVISDKVTEVGNTGMAAYNTGVNTLNSRKTEAGNTLVSKTNEYFIGAKNYLVNQCKNACPSGCCGFSGWCKGQCDNAF
jgi:hypothetical protein